MAHMRGAARLGSGVRVVMLAAACLAASCASTPKTEAPTPFEPAVRALGGDLLKQFNESKLFVGRLGETRMVAAPFVDADSGETNEVSREIERILFDELASGSRKLASLKVERLSSTNLLEAGYVIVGVLAFEPYDQGTTGQKKYRLYASIIDRDSKKIIAASNVWIANTDLDYTPTALYENSPVFPRDRRLRGQVAVAKSAPGTLPDQSYYDALETDALLVEAQSLFERQQYEAALALYQQAAERDDGRVLRTFIGAYQTNLKLGRAEAAEAAFAELIAVGAAEEGVNIKFLFAVNSTEFIANSQMSGQYPMWLRQLAKFFSGSESCVDITGHSSRTGAESYNKRLSFQRAQKIQALMKPAFSEIEQHSTVHGVGWDENIVGSGSDDLRDALDRRVEFALVECAG